MKHYKKRYSKKAKQAAFDFFKPIGDNMKRGDRVKLNDFEIYGYFISEDKTHNKALIYDKHPDMTTNPTSIYTWDMGSFHKV